MRVLEQRKVVGGVNGRQRPGGRLPVHQLADAALQFVGMLHRIVGGKPAQQTLQLAQGVVGVEPAFGGVPGAGVAFVNIQGIFHHPPQPPVRQGADMRPEHLVPAVLRRQQGLAGVGHAGQPRQRPVNAVARAIVINIPVGEQIRQARGDGRGENRQNFPHLVAKIGMLFRCIHCCHCHRRCRL